MSQQEEDASSDSSTSTEDSFSTSADVYTGSLGIWKNLNLTEEEKTIERGFAEQLQSNLFYWMSEYLTRNGRILDTDLARALCPAWDQNNESRARFTSAVHNPASAFINALYEQLLKQPAISEQDTVLFTAGGGGSGKTTVIRQRAAALLDGVYLTYDTTLSRLEPAQQKVEAALAANKNVLIIFVYRPFEAAVQGVIDRAIDEGRTVPLQVLAADHAGAPQTVLQLANLYARNEKVRIIVINNDADVDQATLIDPASDFEGMLRFLQQLAYTQVEDLQQRAQETLNNEITSRRGTLRNIPEYLLAALNRGYIRRTRQ